MISEDLNVLFSGPDAVTVTIGATSFKALLDTPDVEAAEGRIISTDYVLTTKTSDVQNLGYDSELSVEGEAYTVNKTFKIDDGLLSKVYLSKV